MNITKEYYEHVASTKNIIPNYTFQCEKYSPIHKCNRLLKEIKQAEITIQELTTQSMKSSAFNGQHLKFSTAATNVKQILLDIEAEMKILKSNENINGSLSNCEKNIFKNCLDLLNIRASDLTMKFQKFLQNQAVLIKKVEDKKSGSSSFSRTTSNTDYMTNSEENDVFLDFNTQVQETKTAKGTYYQERVGEIKIIEKMMGEISGMMKRMNEMIFHHSLLVENISQNTENAFENVEAGAQEISTYLNNIRNNKRLLIKVLLIIIASSVIYIILFA